MLLSTIDGRSLHRPELGERIVTEHLSILSDEQLRHSHSRIAQEHAFAFCRPRCELLGLQYACEVYLLQNMSLGMAFCHAAWSLSGKPDQLPPSGHYAVAKTQCTAVVLMCYITVSGTGVKGREMTNGFTKYDSWPGLHRCLICANFG